MAQVKEADVKAWLIGWKRSLKTKANYHGLLFGIFSYAVEQGYMVTNPCPHRAEAQPDQAVPGGPALPDRV